MSPVPPDGGTQDTCLSNTSGEEKKKTEHEIVVYPNVRASPTKQLAGAHMNQSDEESSAAGAGAFNGKNVGKSHSNLENV